MTRNLPVNLLVAVAVLGQAIAYALAIFVARNLSISDFEAYVVASAIFILLVALAPLGMEKYTLRQWPVLVGAADWQSARGLLQFGIKRTLLTALIAAGLVAAAIAVPRDGAMRTAILVTCLSLPAGALVHYGVDLLTAAGRPFRALAIFRIAVPATALTLLAVVLASGARPAGWVAVGAWGIGWAVALVLMVASLCPRLDPRLFTAPPRTDNHRWRRESRPFLVYRVTQSLLAQSGILALELSGAGGLEIGAFAAAMSTVGIAAVLASATNRAYGRDLALLLETGDGAAIGALNRRRMVWLLPALALFLVATLGFPATLLGLFRPEFATAGATPLRLLAMTTAVTVLFALAPTQLKFQRHNRALYTVMVVAALAQIGLLIVLVPQFGATGAALAHALTMAGAYCGFAVLAVRARNKHPIATFPF